MNNIQRYMVLNSFLLGVIPVMGQQKEDKEIKLNEEAVKLIQFDFLPESMDKFNKPIEAPLEKKWMEFKNPKKYDRFFLGKEAEEIYPYVSLFHLDKAGRGPCI